MCEYSGGMAKEATVRASDSRVRNLWLAPIYPEKDTIRGGMAAALDLYEKVKREDWKK